MKITPTVLSIPPYISTTWSNVSSLRMRERTGTLIIHLQNGTEVEVPNLDGPTLEEIFEAHARHAETPTSTLASPFGLGIPLSSDNSLETLNAGMQHNPAQSNFPPIPKEVLEKIIVIARALGLDDASLNQQAEPNCNCIHCQIIRSLQSEPQEEEVSESDLHFRDWEVKQTDAKLYTVSNPLDPNEYYQVFLGNPLSCTCTQKNCEHLRAVLRS